MNKINQRTLNLVKEFEGCEKRLSDGRLIAYLDRNATPENLDYDHEAGGLWTIGYGATGPGIKEGTIWTQAKADSDLVARLNEKGQEVLAKLNVKINDNQYGALASIAYNIGTHGIRGLIAKVNEDPDNAGQYFAAYKYGTQNGTKVVMSGLVRRRRAEQELYEWESNKQLKELSPPIQRADQINTGLGATGIGGAFIWQNFSQIQEAAKDHIGLIMLVGLGLTMGIVYLFKKYIHIEFNKGTYVPAGTKPVPTQEDVEAFDVDA